MAASSSNYVEMSSIAVTQSSIISAVKTKLLSRIDLDPKVLVIDEYSQDIIFNVVTQSELMMDHNIVLVLDVTDTKDKFPMHALYILSADDQYEKFLALDKKSNRFATYEIIFLGYFPNPETGIKIQETHPKVSHLHLNQICISGQDHAYHFGAVDHIDFLTQTHLQPYKEALGDEIGEMLAISMEPMKVWPANIFYQQSPADYRSNTRQTCHQTAVSCLKKIRQLIQNQSNAQIDPYSPIELFEKACASETFDLIILDRTFDLITPLSFSLELESALYDINSCHVPVGILESVRDLSVTEAVNHLSERSLEIKTPEVLSAATKIIGFSEQKRIIKESLNILEKLVSRIKSRQVDHLINIQDEIKTGFCLGEGQSKDKLIPVSTMQNLEFLEKIVSDPEYLGIATDVLRILSIIIMTRDLKSHHLAKINQILAKLEIDQQIQNKILGLKSFFPKEKLTYPVLSSYLENHKRQLSQLQTNFHKPSKSQPRRTLIFIIGGITYTEIVLVRKFNAQNKQQFTYIAGSDLIQGSNFIDNILLQTGDI
jgi:hypothetical protein